MKKNVIEFLIEKPKHSFLALMFAVLLSVPGMLKIKEDFTYSIWYNNDDSLMELFRDFQRKFGNDDQAILGIEYPKGVFKRDQLDLIAELVEELSLLKDVMRVEAITNANIVQTSDDEIFIRPLNDFESLGQMKSLALADEALRDIFIDSQASFTTLALTARPDFKSVPDYHNLTLRMNEVLERYEKMGITFHRAGSIVLTYWFKQVTLDDMGVLGPTAMGMFVILLWLFFRRLAGIFISLSIILVSIILMTGLAGYLGHTLNTISSAAPTILLTVALADAVHFLTHYFYCLRGGALNKDAVRKSLEKNFSPTLITSLTTFLGFVSFGSSQVVPIADLGVQVGCGVLIAWGVSIIIFSAFTLRFPLQPREKKQLVSDRQKILDLKILENLIGYRWYYLIGSLLIGVICFYFVKDLYVSMDPIKQFDKNHIVPKDFYLIEDKMKSAANLEVMIKDQDIQNPKFLKAVEKFTLWLEGKAYVHKTSSFLNILKTMKKHMDGKYQLPASREETAQLLLLYTMGLPAGQNIEQWVSLNKDAVRVTVFWNIHNSKDALKIIDQINAYGEEHQLDLKVTGKMPLFHNLTPYVVNTFFVSFSTALVLITGIMMLLLRSIKLGLLTLIPNLLPIIMGGLIVYVAKFQVDIGIVIVASVCLGIAVDDSIHILFEYRRHRRTGKTLLQAFQIIYESTLPALFITTLIIALGFGTFLLANYIPNSRFGVLVAIILIFAFIFDAILFPVIMAIFDKHVRANEN